jgi:hypothetical protein
MSAQDYAFDTAFGIPKGDGASDSSAGASYEHDFGGLREGGRLSRIDGWIDVCVEGVYKTDTGVRRSVHLAIPACNA